MSTVIQQQIQSSSFRRLVIRELRNLATSYPCLDVIVVDRKRVKVECSYKYVPTFHLRYSEKYDLFRIRIGDLPVIAMRIENQSELRQFCTLVTTFINLRAGVTLPIPQSKAA